MDRLGTACPHCGGPEQLAPACATCGALLWFQTPVPEDVEDTAERHYLGLSEPENTVVRGLPGQPPGASPVPPPPAADDRPAWSAGRPSSPASPGGFGGLGGPGVLGGPGGSDGPGGPARTEDPGSRRRTMRGIAMAGIAVVLIALVLGGWRFLEDEEPDVPVADPGRSDVAEPGESRGVGDEPGGDEPGGAGPEEPQEPQDPTCAGDYVLVTPAATDVPGSCEELAAAVADAASSAAVPAAFEGPFKSARVACRRRDEIGGSEVHVRQVAEDAGPRVACACLIAPRKLPDLGPIGVEGAGVGRGVSVSDAQVLLHEAGLNPDLEVGGSYDEQTGEWVRLLQRESGLPLTGRVDRDTWKALLGSCG